MLLLWPHQPITNKWIIVLKPLPNWRNSFATLVCMTWVLLTVVQAFHQESNQSIFVVGIWAIVTVVWLAGMLERLR